MIFYSFPSLQDFKGKKSVCQGLCCCFWFQDYIKNIDEDNGNTILKGK